MSAKDPPACSPALAALPVASRAPLATPSPTPDAIRSAIALAMMAPRSLPTFAACPEVCAWNFAKKPSLEGNTSTYTDPVEAPSLGMTHPASVPSPNE